MIEIMLSFALSVVSRHFIHHLTSESWGSSILIMEKNGKAFGRAYWYHDDNTSIYLDWLSVDESSRRKGIATKLQEMREEIGRRLGATTSCLWVKKDTWMHEWYKRRGYEDLKDYKDDENAVWMSKALNKTLTNYTKELWQQDFRIS